MVVGECLWNLMSDCRGRERRMMDAIGKLIGIARDRGSGFGRLRLLGDELRCSKLQRITCKGRRVGNSNSGGGGSGGGGGFGGN